MSDPIVINQNISYDQQNYEIDIDLIYKDFIQSIDAHRSMVVLNTNPNFKFDKNTINGFIDKSKIETVPQESRCHTFFRMIGFPVVSSNFDFYNPGFDSCNMEENGLSRKITLDTKIRIANDPIDKFNALSQQRENYINRFFNVFGQSFSIDAGCLALSCINIRDFTIPLQDIDPFDTIPISQTYTANFSSQIGLLTQVSLLDYVDENGNKPALNNLQTNRYHFIKPFIVDQKIEANCAALSNDKGIYNKKIAVPFVFNKSNLRMGNNIVKRPLIEKIIRDRIIVNNEVETLGTAIQDIRNYILGIPSVQDDELIQQMIDGKIYKTSEQQQFNKYLRIIGSMMTKLVQSQLIIQHIQSTYYWLPIPSPSGPEGGSKVRDIIISIKLPSDYITETDRSLINSLLRQNAQQLTVQTANINGIADPGDFVLGPFTTTFDSDTSESLGSIINKTVSSLKEERFHDMSSGNDALKTIEIIMGEFSGFGLCDIIAIMGALYIIPIQDLIGFLDQDAYARMVYVLGLKDLPPQSDLTTAMQSLTLRVKDYYNLMNEIYLDIKNRQSGV